MLCPVGIPIVVARRGGVGEHPESTTEAFLTMGERGFRYLETDACAIFDDVITLCHNATLGRTVGAAGRIRGYIWGEPAGVHDGGPTVLCVDETLERHPDAVFDIDAKSDDTTAPLVRTIREAGVQNRVCAVSFLEHQLRRIRGELPGTASPLDISTITRIVVTSRTRTRTTHRHLLKGLPDTQVAQVLLSSRKVSVLTERSVASVYEAGIMIHTWMINDVDTIARFLDTGVDGVITDVPTTVYEGL